MQEKFDLLCLSHLRWDFVFQRPQHLLTRFRRGTVFFFEEPVFDGNTPRLEISKRTENVRVVVPHLPAGLAPMEQNEAQAKLLEELCRDACNPNFVLWYYTPSSLAFSRELPRPLLTVYDCMDELSHFKNAPAGLKALEQELFQRADLVFTGGESLYQAKKNQHRNIHAFPSSVDVEHFAQARVVQAEPEDQANIPRPRVGYFGVIDERLDLEFLRQLAAARPDLQLVLVGPVCKIDWSDLPEAPNLHYLGGKSYQDLPRYLAGWDVAMMPFARNEATLYISPTKTPEYLAGGKPVVSTSIADVIHPYQALGLVRIADSPPAFAQAVDEAIAEDASHRQKIAQAFLDKNSWDITWSRMEHLMDTLVKSSHIQMVG